MALLSIPKTGQTQDWPKFSYSDSKKFPGGGKQTTEWQDGSKKVVEDNKDHTVTETSVFYPNGKTQTISIEKKKPDGTLIRDFTGFDQNGKITSNGKVLFEPQGGKFKIISYQKDSWKFDEAGRLIQHVKIDSKEGEITATLETTTYQHFQDKTGTTTKRNIHWDGEGKKWVDDFGIEVKEIDPLPAQSVKSQKKTAETQPQKTDKTSGPEDNIRQPELLMGFAPPLGSNPSLILPVWLTQGASKPQLPKPPIKTSGSLDPCLVGTWRSEPVGANMIGVTGGAGILVTFKGDGTETISYNGMQPFKGGYGDTNIWSGEAEGHITTDKGIATVGSVEHSTVKHTHTGPGGSRTNPLTGGLGPAGLGNNRLDPSYTCDKNRLTYKDPARTFVFLRLDKNGVPIEGPKIDEQGPASQPAEPIAPKPEGLSTPDLPEALRKTCEPEYSRALADAEQNFKEAAFQRKSAESFRFSGMSTRKTAQEDRKLSEFARGTLMKAISNGDKKAEEEIRQQIETYNKRAQFEEASAEYDLQKAASAEQKAKELEQAAQEIRKQAAQNCLNHSGAN